MQHPSLFGAFFEAVLPVSEKLSRPLQGVKDEIILNSKFLIHIPLVDKVTLSCGFRQNFNDQSRRLFYKVRGLMVADNEEIGTKYSVVINPPIKLEEYLAVHTPRFLGCARECVMKGAAYLLVFSFCRGAHGHRDTRPQFPVTLPLGVVFHGIMWDIAG
jgi:hypothetical protein